jgi:hypothetical protein
VLVANGFRVDALHEIVPPAPTAIVDENPPALVNPGDVDLARLRCRSADLTVIELPSTVS